MNSGNGVSVTVNEIAHLDFGLIRMSFITEFVSKTGRTISLVNVRLGKEILQLLHAE